MKQPPCRDCTEKGCGEKHDTCLKYQQWRKDRETILQAAHEERKTRNAIVESVLRIKRKAKK